MEDVPQEPIEQERREQLPGGTPSIWAGSLLDYNNGILHGEWIEVDGDAAHLHEQVQAVLARSPTATQSGELAEEWGIFDYEYFGNLRLGEYESLDTVNAWAAGIREHGPAYAAWVELDPDSHRAQSDFEDAYIGEYGAVEYYAEELLRDAGVELLLNDHVPPGLRQYVTLDTVGLAHNMHMSGELQVVFHEGGVWLYHND